MSDYELVLSSTKRLEGILQSKFSASGQGLHEKVTSVESRLNPDMVRVIRRIAVIRNKLLHEDGYALSSSDRSWFETNAKQAVNYLSQDSHGVSEASAGEPFVQGSRRNPILLHRVFRNAELPPRKTAGGHVLQGTFFSAFVVIGLVIGLFIVWYSVRGGYRVSGVGGAIGFGLLGLFGALGLLGGSVIVGEHAGRLVGRLADAWKPLLVGAAVLALIGATWGLKIGVMDGKPRPGDAQALAGDGAREALPECDVAAVQRRLLKAGLDPGTVDGVFGQVTRRALVIYQGQHGLPQTAVLDQTTCAQLESD